MLYYLGIHKKGLSDNAVLSIARRMIPELDDLYLRRTLDTKIHMYSTDNQKTYNERTGKYRKSKYELCEYVLEVTDHNMITNNVTPQRVHNLEKILGIERGNLKFKHYAKN